jgi:ABC-type sugar transport system permease subunit
MAEPRPVIDVAESKLEFGRGLLWRVVLLSLLNAVALYSFFMIMSQQAWGLMISLVVGTLFINWAYLSPRSAAMRWIAPGLVLMSAFVIFPLVFTVYVAFTNWSTGNILTKGQSIEVWENEAYIDRDDPGESFELQIFVDDGGTFRFYLEDETGEVFFGQPRETDAEVGSSVTESLAEYEVVDADGDGLPEQVGPFVRLQGRDVFQRAGDIQSLVLDLEGGGVVEPLSISLDGTAEARLIVASQRYVYDEAGDVLIDTVLDRVCEPDRGNWVCDLGKASEERLDRGWVVPIGLENFTNVATNPRIRGPFLRVFLWNIVFATGTVFLAFSVGMLFAVVLQKDGMRGKFFYRSVYVIPYAIPAFLSILIWRGLLNENFGQVNELLGAFGVSPIPWLSDGTWAKVAVLLVNTWLGFPYMFLITTGALQAIPQELTEAARVDGASGIQVFRRITFPLLMVSLAPLLIGAFAFNFNNFVLIFLLTNGGPPILDAAVPVGETDILISFTFDVAVQSGRGQNFGLGSAITVFIFFLVATISAFSFRFTRRLEEVYGGA